MIKKDEVPGRVLEFAHSTDAKNKTVAEKPFGGFSTFQNEGRWGILRTILCHTSWPVRRHGRTTQLL